MVEKIENILREVLPTGTDITVIERKNCLGEGNYIKIAFCPKAPTINNVSGQYAQMVSLSLNVPTMELITQVYGGHGGQLIYRKPDKGSYLAMQRIKIPFRKPKNEEKFVLKAIKSFAERWLQAIKDNKEVLMHQDLIDYDQYLAS